MSNPSTRVLDRLRWSYDQTVLTLTATAFFGTYVARLAVSPVVPDVVGTFDVTTGDVGLVLTAMWAVYALMQFPGGLLGEKFGERTVILASLVLTGVGSLLLAVSPSFLLFGAATVFIGLGAGLYFPVATSFLDFQFENTGRALGFHNVGAPAAGLLTPIAVAFVAARYGWRPAVALGAAAAFPIVLAYGFLIRSGDASQPDLRLVEQIDLGRFRELLFQPAIAYTLVLGSTAVFAVQAVMSFFPTFLIEYGGFDAATASYAFSGIFVLQGVWLPTMGRLSDRIGRDAIIAGAFLVASTALAILVAVPLTPVTAGVAVLLFGLGMSWPPAIQSRFVDNLSEENQNFGFGLVRSIYMEVGSLGSVVTGTLASTVGWQFAFGLIAVMFVVASATLVANYLLGSRM